MMKKIFSAILVVGMIFLTKNCFAAQAVRISDYGVDGFVERYNQIAMNPSVKYDIAIKEKPQNFGPVDINGKVYVNYMAECGSRGSGVIINFMTTPDGYISRILIFAKRDAAVETNAGAVSGIALVAAGMNPNEFTDFAGKITQTDNGTYYWSSSMKRYIIYELDNSNAEIACIRLSAFVQ